MLAEDEQVSAVWGTGSSGPGVSHLRGEHKKTPLALEPWNSHSEDGGPVCLLPCLKSSMGLLLPFFLPPLHVKYCEEMPWHFSDFVAWNAQCSSLRVPTVAACHVTRCHSKFRGHHNKMIYSGCTSQCLERFLKLFLLDFDPVLALVLIGIMRKASHWTSWGF